MALNLHCLTQILKVCQLLNDQGNTKIRILSVGYPDLVLTRNSYNKFVKKYSISQDILANQAPVMNWHKLNSSRFVALSLKRILQLNFNVYFNYIDIQEGTGLAEDVDDFIEMDLNLPISESSQFDLIIDSGTAEHCFNIGRVFSTYHQLLSLGGYLYQWSPFISPNHGFYSINPTLYFDLARDHMFELKDYCLHMYTNYGAYFKCKSRKVPFRTIGKFRLWPWFSSSTMLNEVILKKTSDLFSYPIQSKYLPKKSL